MKELIYEGRLALTSLLVLWAVRAVPPGARPVLEALSSACRVLAEA